jgi:hypothetical protein
MNTLRNIKAVGLDLEPGKQVVLELCGSETLVRAYVIGRVKQPGMGWGWTFQMRDNTRMFIYEKDLAPTVPALLVTDGR